MNSEVSPSSIEGVTLKVSPAPTAKFISAVTVPAAPPSVSSNGLGEEVAVNSGVWSTPPPPFPPPPDVTSKVSTLKIASR